MKNNHNINCKDGIFRSLFNEKEKMLELYNAVNGTNYGEEMLEKLQVLTIGTSLGLEFRNDCAFTLPDRIVLFTGHPSSLCANMDIHMVSYLSKIIQTMFSYQIYLNKPIKIPPPEFFVIYNGTKETPAEKIFNLSDHYACKPHRNTMELSVKFINACYDKDKEILKKSPTLREYSLLMSYINEEIKAGKNKDEAIATAIKRASGEGLLKGFLKKNAPQVIDMLRGEVVIG